MSSLPIFRLKVSDNNGNNLYDLNMGAVLLSMDTRRAFTILEKLANGQKNIGYLPLYKGMPRHHLEDLISTNSNDVIEYDMHSEARSFYERIGGKSGYRQFVELNRYRETLERKKDRIFAELTHLNSATFILAPAAKNEMLYDNLGEKFGDVETLLMQYSMPKDISKMGDTPERHKAFNCWIRINGRPYAWDTFRNDWNGVTVDDVLSCWDDIHDEDNEDEAIKSLDIRQQLIDEVKANIDSQLGIDHYEDAQYDVVDIGDIDGIITSWFEDKQKNEQFADQNLKERLETWAEKQFITSYHQDSSTIVGLHPDVTETECKQFMEREFSNLRLEIDNIDNMWRQPITESFHEVSERLESSGIWLTHGPYDLIYRIRSTPDDLDAEFPTLELAVEFAQGLAR